MNLKRWCFITFLLCISSDVIFCYKGLFVMTFGTKSHLNFFSSIIKTMAQEGHEMTLVTPYEVKFDEKNVKQIVVRDKNIDIIYGNLFNATIPGLFGLILDYSSQICVKSLETFLAIQDSKNSRLNYDFAIISVFNTECYLGFIYENKIPLIFANPNMLIPPMDIILGEPSFPSVNPNLFTTLVYPMTFFERLANIFADLQHTLFLYRNKKRMESFAREANLWKPETPSVFEIETTASLALINRIKALEKPIKASPPTIIYAGGLHIQQPKSLPEDLKSWCDESEKHGFILFSLGTAVKPEEMIDSHLQAILNVFRTLNQRVIWKWGSDELENLPPNVKLVSWLPQQDILAHPNIKLFITHGGAFSIQEATYFGVPVLGMPVFGDQMNNIAEAESKGFGRYLKWKDLSEKSFRLALMDAMENATIREEVNKISLLMRDWPITPSKQVLYWIEYVVRHKGAGHLRSPLASMSWIKIYNMDVWAFVISILIILFIIIYLILKIFYKFLKSRLFKIKVD